MTNQSTTGTNGFLTIYWAQNKELGYCNLGDFPLSPSKVKPSVTAIMTFQAMIPKLSTLPSDSANWTLVEEQDPIIPPKLLMERAITTCLLTVSHQSWN